MRVTVVCARSGRRRAGREVLGEGSDTCSGAVGAAFIVSSPYAKVGGEGGAHSDRSDRHQWHRRRKHRQRS